RRTYVLAGSIDPPGDVHRSFALLRMTSKLNYARRRPCLTRSAFTFSKGIPPSPRRDSETRPSQKSCSRAPCFFRSMRTFALQSGHFFFQTRLPCCGPLFCFPPKSLSLSHLGARKSPSGL